MIMELRQHYKTKYGNPELVIKFKLLCDETKRLMFKDANVAITCVLRDNKIVAIFIKLLIE